MKTTITRSELKEIHDIVCQDWQETIKTYASRNPFQDTIEFTEKEIEDGLNACSKPEHSILIKKLFDIQDITSKITNFKAVLDYLGEDDKEVILYRKMLKSEINGKPLQIQMAICWNRALNEKYEFKQEDKKWRIWWNLYPFGFNCSVWFESSTDVPLALCFKNQELADFAGNNKEYQELCKQFIY